MVDVTFIPDALKDKITFMPNRKDHYFRATKTAFGVGTGVNAEEIMFF